MKSTVVILALLQDLGQDCDVHTSRDAKTIARRVSQEGEQFLSKTLPAYQKWLDRALLDPSYPPPKGFALRLGLPVFLRGFLDNIFTRESGVVSIRTDDAEVARNIRAVRQLAGFYGKEFQTPSEATISRDMDAFIETDRRMTEPDAQRLLPVWRRLFGGALGRMEAELFRNGVIPKHGPGAVADHSSQNQKWRFDEWPSSLHTYFPSWHYARTVMGSLDLGQPVLTQRPNSRLVAVPKTALRSRLIAIEPTAHQYIQQGLFSLLEECVRPSRSWQHLNWRDQTRNQILARKGSIDGSISTIDLSEASDRVHSALVWDLLQDHKFLRGAVFASRSEQIEIRGEIHDLKKFASMGSALTFPIECMVFLAIALLGGCDETGTDPRSCEQLLTPEVSVYGDDIIVPVGWTESVFKALSEFGFVVNEDKSFYSGGFRESCGSDWYKGYDVSYVKVRSPLARSRTPEHVVKTIALHNHLFEAGREKASAAVIRDMGNIPYVPFGSDLLGLWTMDSKRVRKRFNRSLQRLEYRALTYVTPPPKDALDGFQAWLKCLMLREGVSDPLEQDHLDRTGRPWAGRIKPRWGVSYMP